MMTMLLLLISVITIEGFNVIDNHQQKNIYNTNKTQSDNSTLFTLLNTFYYIIYSVK